MRPRLLSIAWLLVLAPLAAAPAADAELLFSYSGTTKFGPSFVRPALGQTDVVAGQRSVRYHTRSFKLSPGGAGAVNCVVDSIQNGNFIGVVYIYRLAFDPQQPQNFIRASGRDGRLGDQSASTSVFSVSVNTPYVVVTADFSNRQSPSASSDGEFQNTISCLDPLGPLEPGLAIEAEQSDEPALRDQQVPGNCLIGNVTVPGCVGPPTSPGRFQITVTFSTFQDPTVRQARLAPFGSGESALFSFFQPTNFEVLVKVLNFCNESSNSYRVFAAGMTDVNVTVTVTDTVKGGPPIVIQNVTPNRFNFQERNFPTSSCS